MATLNESTITEILSTIRSEQGGNPYLQIRLWHPDVDWTHLGCCVNYGLPAVDQGQTGDCRWSLDNGEALHAHWFPDRGYVRFHIDRQDPMRNPVGHALSDTYMLWGAAMGGLLGVLASKSWFGLLTGIATGGALGAHLAPRPSGIWELCSYHPSRGFLIQPISTNQVQQAA